VADAEHGRLDRLPDVDVRVPDDEQAGLGQAGRDPALFGAGHQVVDQHAEPPPVPGLELGQDLRQVVDTLQVLDHHTDVAQVVAPDLLHQLGVVPSFDVDAAGPGHPGPRLRRRHRAGRVAGRPRGHRRPGGGRPDQRHRPSVNHEGRRVQREHPPLAVPVLQRDRALVAAHDRAAETAFDVLDDQPVLRWQLRNLRALAPPGGQHVAAVVVASHARTVPDRPLARPNATLSGSIRSRTS
jgi:hypothetical protein